MQSGISYTIWVETINRILCSDMSSKEEKEFIT